MKLPVFLVEDNLALRAQLTHLITQSCEAEVVATAESEAEAIHWVAGHPDGWALMVLDLFLKQGTGFGVLSSLADPAHRERVIVLTNSATAENRARSLALGASAVYDKTDELSQFIDHFAGRCDPQQF